MLEPTERDDIIGSLRGLLHTDVRLLLRDELKMMHAAHPLIVEGDDVPTVAGPGPMFVAELREMEVERDRYKAIAHNVKEERNTLRAVVSELEERMLALNQELAVYKTALGELGQLRLRLNVLLGGDQPSPENPGLSD